MNGMRIRGKRDRENKEYQSNEVYFLSELMERNREELIGLKVRTIGILSLLSPISAQLFWKDSFMRVDLELAHLERFTEETLYQILGEIQENMVGLSFCFVVVFDFFSLIGGVSY